MIDPKNVYLKTASGTASIPGLRMYDINGGRCGVPGTGDITVTTTLTSLKDLWETATGEVWDDVVGNVASVISDPIEDTNVLVFLGNRQTATQDLTAAEGAHFVVNPTLLPQEVINTYGPFDSSDVATYITNNLNPDTYTLGVNTDSHLYPEMSIDNPASGITRGPFNVFVTGNNQFEQTAFSFVTGTLAAGGLVVTKTNAFTNLTLMSGMMFEVVSGTGAVAGIYPIASKDSASQLTLSAPAGAGGGASDLVGRIKMFNNDPTIIFGYNNGGLTANNLAVAGEYSCGLVMETGYNRNDANFRRDCEVYFRFCKKDGTGAEIRPFNISYDIDAHKLAEMTILTKAVSHGGTLDIARSETGTTIFQFGDNGCDLRGYNNNTSFNLHAPAGKVGKLSVGADAVDDVLIFQATSDVRVDFSVGGQAWISGRDTNSGSIVTSINSTRNSHALDITAPDSGWGGAALALRQRASVTNPLFRVDDTTGDFRAGYTHDGYPLEKVQTIDMSAVSCSTQADAITNATVTAPTCRATNVSSGKGVALPVAKAGMRVTVVNDTSGVTAMAVWGQSGETINNIASATGTTITAKTAAIFVCVVDGSWFKNP